MSTTNLIDAAMASQATQLPPATEPKPPAGGNLVDQAMGLPPVSAAKPVEAPGASSPNLIDQAMGMSALPTAASATSDPQESLLAPPKVNLIDQAMNQADKYGKGVDTRGLTAEERTYGNSDPEKMEDEPWYSKAWEWMNSPLYDLHKWGTREDAGTFERGLETGLEDIGSGFLTPLQLGLTIATFGGSTVETAGLSALKSIGVSELAAPIVARTAKGLLTAGFTLDMLHGLMTQSPQFLDALKDGDVENATRLGTNILASSIFIREGLKHGIEDANAVKNYVKGKDLTTTDRLKLAAELSGLYEQNKSMGTDKARGRTEDIIQQLMAAGVKDKTTEAGIRHFMTQDGDVDRISKMVGIAEGTIKPREYTPEEQKQIEGAVELRKWAGESNPALKEKDGSPMVVYLTDSAEGTHQLGQTLGTSGDLADAHYIQMKKPASFNSEEALKAYVDRIGKETGLEDPKEAQVAAVHVLEGAGHDGVMYKDAEGKLKFITFDDDQYRPVEKFKSAADQAWNREHVYYATDKKYTDQIKNAGIKSPRRETVQYYTTPEEALKNAALPDSGEKNDLAVFSVPRAEVEQGIYEENAATRGKVPDRAQIGPVEVLPRAKREAGPVDTGKYEPHIFLPEKVKESAQVSSDQEIHAHELAHSIWARLRGLPLGDIHSHKSIDAVSQNFVAAAEIGLERFKNRFNEWEPSKIKGPHVEALVDSMMAGTAADELISGIRPDKNYGNAGDIQDIHDLLESVGVGSKSVRKSIIEASLERVKEEMHKHGIDDIIKEEFAKGREQGLSPQLHYSRERLQKIAQRAKDAINAKESDVAAQTSGQRDLQGKVFRRAEAGPEGPSAEDVQGKRPPIDDDLLFTGKNHMPAHQLEVDEKGNPTGRSVHLRPVGAENLPSDNSRFQNAYTPEEKKEYIDGLKKAMSLTEDQQAIGKSLRQLYDNSFQRAWEHGLIRRWVEAYHPQAWADENNSLWSKVFGKDKEKVTNGSLNDLRSDTNSGRFDTNINQAKHRAYMTEFQGIMAGEKFKSDDLAMHAFNHMSAIEHAVAARTYVDDLRAKSLKAADGRPAAVLAGTSRVIGADTNNPAVAISPQSVKAIHISPEKIQAMREGINPRTNMTDLDEALQNGTIERLPWTIDAEGPDGKPRKENAYAYSTEGYTSIDHPSMRGWGFSGVDTAGNPALLHGNIMVHPDFAEEVRRVVGAEKSIVRESPALRGINAVAGEAKGLLLSISPFHIVQEGLRAAMMGISPFKADHIDINTSPELQRGVKNGLVRNDYRAQDKFSAGYASHSKLISAIPGLNRFQNWMQEFLFDKYIPSLKDRAYLKMIEDMRDQYPHLTADEAAGRAADTVNDMFGGQNWRKLGVSASQQDFMRMAALAPDWLVSEVRMLARAGGLMDKETGAYSRKMMAKQLAGIWVAARVLNMLTSGQMHNEAPFGVASKNEQGEEKIYSIRTLPTDLVHMMSDPEHFLAGRVNPLTVRPTVEFLTGRDAVGRRAPFDTQARDLVRNIVPIAGQGLIRGGELGTFDQIVKASGAAVLKYRTEAEKLAQQYASDRMPSGPVDPANLAKHQEDIRLEDGLRKGQISRGELLQHVSKRRADEIIRRAPMSPLQARFDRLPLSESVNVWDASTKSEKDELKSMLWKKRISYMKQHTGIEREGDPTWRKLQSIYADLR